ncbi:MAG: M23 family metallopeptidase [Anaerolineales bacterium]
MRRIVSLVLATFWVLTGCGLAPTPAATATSVVAGVLPPSPAPTGESVPTPLCPNLDCVYVTPSAKKPETLRFDLPTPGVESVSAWRPPQYPVPLALGPFDHFYFARPIAANEINWPAADYRYGGIFDQNVTHTGVDIDAKYGTPVLAAGPGAVIWAGWGLFSSSPGNLQDPYGMAVAIRHNFGYQGKQLYTVYAHMSAVDVAIGQWVDTGTPLGKVGATGHVTGPHLHFEVRLGENSYYSTRNPELWLAPAQGWGVLAGRIMGDNAKISNSQPVVIDSADGKHQWVVNTYGPGAAIPDAYYHENMVISDLPAGDYIVTVVTYAVAHKLKVTIVPGQVTFFSYQNVRGFSTTPPPPPSIFTPTPVR